MNKLFLLFVAAGFVGCANPKILVKQDFVGENKTGKMLLLKTEKEAVKGEKLFNTFVRVCTLDSNEKETSCKDTLVLENVVPASIY